MAGKLPNIHFYPGDWLRDQVASCTLPAQGLWLRMMFIMHDSDKYGYLSINGVPMDSGTISRRCGCSLEEYGVLFAELTAAGVPSISKDGVIFSRRMVRDQKDRKESQRQGRRGGNPKLGVLYNMPGFLYLMRREDGMVKVGISANPTKRCQKLRKSQNDSSIKVIGQTRVEDMGGSEAELHGRLAEYPREGEWYRLPKCIVFQVLTEFSTPKPPPLPSSEDEGEDEIEGERVPGENQPSAEENPGFARFWAAWPQHFRKADKPKCLARWKSAGCESAADSILAAVDAWKKSDQWKKDSGNFIPAPLVWLNQSKWEAAHPPASKNAMPNVGSSRVNAELEHSRAEALRRDMAVIAYLSGLEPTSQDILIAEFKRECGVDREVTQSNNRYRAWVYERIKRGEAA